MTETERPQIYLISPPEVDLDTFPGVLANVLDTAEVACVRLALSSTDESQILRVGDSLREITHARDIALVIETHVMMVERLGLDGVHLTDGARSVRYVRKELGADAIIGTFCGTSRHDGMNAGEAGADYISFGPVGQTALGDGKLADPEIFDWWSEVIEVPIIAEGGLDEETIARLGNVTDFFAFGPEIWGAENPATQLQTLIQAMG